MAISDTALWYWTSGEYNAELVSLFIPPTAADVVALVSNLPPWLHFPWGSVVGSKAKMQVDLTTELYS